MSTPSARKQLAIAKMEARRALRGKPPKPKRKTPKPAVVCRPGVPATIEYGNPLAVATAATPAQYPFHAKVTFPFMLPSRNKHNHGHWSAEAKAIGQIVAAVHETLGLGNVKKPTITQWPVRLVWTVYVPITRDCGNVDEKAATDALVRAGWLPDDGPKYVAEVALRARKGQPPRTELCIEPWHGGSE